MKWFHVFFQEEDLSSSTDERLIKDFINLTHQLKHPMGLGLYHLKYRVDDGMVIYLSSPDEVSYKLKSILAHYPSQEVNNPNKKLLKLVVGKSLDEIDNL